MLALQVGAAKQTCLCHFGITLKIVFYITRPLHYSKILQQTFLLFHASSNNHDRLEYDEQHCRLVYSCK